MIGLWLIELITPPLLLLPGLCAPFRSVRTAVALLQVVFQAVLVSSGNLAFLNWLTITPAFLCLSDATLAPLAPPATLSAATAAAAAATLLTSQHDPD